MILQGRLAADGLLSLSVEEAMHRQNWQALLFGIILLLLCLVQ